MIYFRSNLKGKQDLRQAILIRKVQLHFTYCNFRIKGWICIIQELRSCTLSEVFLILVQKSKRERVCVRAVRIDSVSVVFYGNSGVIYNGTRVVELKLDTRWILEKNAALVHNRGHQNCAVCAEWKLLLWDKIDLHVVTLENIYIHLKIPLELDVFLAYPSRIRLDSVIEKIYVCKIFNQEISVLKVPYATNEAVIIGIKY